VYIWFLPERHYVTFGYMLSHIRLSSVTFVHPTQSLWAVFANLYCTCAQTANSQRSISILISPLGLATRIS